MKPWEIRCITLALSCWSIFLFTSISLCALGHLFLLPVALSRFPTLFKNLPRSTIILWAIFIWGVICSLVNFQTMEQPLQHLLKLKYFFFGAIMVPLFSSYFKYVNINVLRICLNVFLISTTIASLSGLIAYVTNFNPLRFRAACHPDRACGMNGMYMTYGYGIGAYLSTMNSINNKKLVSMLQIFINGLGFILSKARGAWISLFISIPFMLFSKKTMKRFLLSLCAISIFFAINLKWNPMVHNMFFQEQRILSNNIRISLFKSAFYAWKENPIFGLGFKNFEPNVKRIKQKYNIEFPDFQGHAHNNFIEHTASMGSLGGILLILFFYFWIKELWIKQSTMLPFAIYTLVSGLFQYTLGDASNLFLIMLLYALSTLKNEGQICQS